MGCIYCIYIKVEIFSCLGCIVTNNGMYDKDIMRCTGMAKTVFNRMSNVLLVVTQTNKVGKILHCYVVVRSIMLDGSNAWPILKTMQNRLQAAEHSRGFLGRMRSILWTGNKNMWR